MAPTSLVDFKLLFEKVPGLYLVLQPDFTIVAVSDSYLEATMTRREDILGLGLFEVFPDNPDDAQATGVSNLRASLMYALQHKQPHRMTTQKYDIRRADGSFEVRYWSPLNTPVLDANNQIIYLIHNVTDVTGPNRSEERFRSFMDAGPDAIIIVDENGMIDIMNYQAENIFGYNRQEMEGHPVDMIIPGIVNGLLQYEGNFMAEAALQITDSDLYAVKKNGVVFPVEISSSTIQTEDGVLVSIAVRDVSERKELENKLRKSNEELEAFSYSVSHDLRAPLRSIIGFTTILEEEYSNKLDAEAKRITAIIKNSTLKMGKLIDALLNFFLLGRLPISKTEVNSNHIISELINEVVSKKDKKKINWTIPALPLAKADASTIKQVWTNLISNAVKYSAGQERPVIEIGAETQPGETIFFVKDNGAGFDDKYQEKLFKVFQRLHSAKEFEGTGVGLAIVEKIVSRHGGRVWAHGEVNQGACFYFSLPVE